MIAVGADSQDPQHDHPFNGAPFTFTSNELPSSSCDFGDLNLPLDNDVIEDILLQNFNDVLLPLDVNDQMHFGDSLFFNHSACNLTTALLEDTKRPRDLNLSFLGETKITPHQMPDPNLRLLVDQSGAVTPPYPGGNTPPNLSRAASPAWSESSGNISTSSLSTPIGQQLGNSIPRHKRPSHKRAEIKRRDKIKTGLDDLKEFVPSLREKGKLSESAILSKAAEYIHQLKDGCAERGSKTANLRREIQCLSEEIHSFQESLPAQGLKEEKCTTCVPTMDALYQQWILKQSNTSTSTKFSIFTSITSTLFESFKKMVGSSKTQDSFQAQTQEWQANCLSLPVLRKEILKGMRELSRKTSLSAFSVSTLKMESDVDGNS